MEERSGKMGVKAEKRIWLAAFALLLISQVMTMVYFGGKKAGFHEDEYYSFYSTNRTAGLYEPDREWVDRDTFRNEFVVLPGEGFRYGLVATVQSWDVHPPFFYFILHTACSLFPGVFSKWLGIGVNIVAFVLNFILLSWLAYMVTGRNKGLAFVTAAVHGFNPVIISGVMFIRMYEWLTVFILLCACLHVRAVLGRKKFLLPLMVVNYLGFLTQYYYIIFLFFMAVGFCLWNLAPCVGRKEDDSPGTHDWRGGRFIIRKEVLGKCVVSCVKYGAACGVSLLLAVFSYPASLAHIFRGYRGTGAVSEFLDAANTGERLGFFLGLADEYLFDGYFWLWFAAFAVMGVMVYRKRKKGEKAENAVGTRTRSGVEKTAASAYGLLLFAVCGYFFTVSKTALLLYETSNRYQLPVYGIIMLLTVAALSGLWKEFVRLWYRGNGKTSGRFAAAGGVLLCFLLLAGDFHEIASGKMIFLYEEEQEDVAYARENAKVPVVVLYNEATPYHIWWRSQELMEYDRIYFASQGNKERITDGVICGSGKLIVYAADYDTKEESLRMILESNEGLKDYRLVSQRSLWSVYEFE